MHRNNSKYFERFKETPETIRYIKDALKEAVRQTGLSEDKCCIAVKGGDESTALKELFDWDGAVLDLNTLVCPGYDRQPACVISMFRQCGNNFHLNVKQNRQLSEGTLPWWPKVLVKTDVDKSGHVKKRTIGYLHCPLSECLYFKWWLHMWYPFLCYSHKHSSPVHHKYDWQSRYEMCADWMALKKNILDCEADAERESILERLKQN